MTVFHDPNAPEGRVVFGGEVFIDGRTADIEIDAGTRDLFKGAGIVEAPAESSDGPTETAAHGVDAAPADPAKPRKRS